MLDHARKSKTQSGHQRTAKLERASVSTLGLLARMREDDDQQARAGRPWQCWTMHGRARCTQVIRELPSWNEQARCATHTRVRRRLVTSQLPNWIARRPSLWCRLLAILKEEACRPWQCWTTHTRVRRTPVSANQRTAKQERASVITLGLLACTLR